MAIPEREAAFAKWMGKVGELLSDRVHLGFLDLDIEEKRYRNWWHSGASPEDVAEDILGQIKEKYGYRSS